MSSHTLPRFILSGSFRKLAASILAPVALAAAASAATITNADLTAAALSGKAVTCTITSGGAPCETTGTFQVLFDSPSAGHYTIPAGSGSTVAHTGTYTIDQYPPDLAFVNLYDYETGARVEFELRTSTSYDSIALGGGKVSFGFTRVAGGDGTLGTGTMQGYKEGYYEIGSGGGGGDGGGQTAAPVISVQPRSQTIALGGSVTFTVTVTGEALSYQWYFNDVAISGEVNSSLVLSAITAARAGSYTVKISNTGGTVTSDAATLTLATASTSGHLTNMSVRASAGAGDQTLIVGLVVGGSGTSGPKDILVRAVGPALQEFQLTNFLADPKLTAYAGGAAIATNDNWGGDATLTALSARLGAFALGASSKDAVLSLVQSSGAYTFHITGGTSGLALAEIYDATENLTETTPRLINVSARAQVGAGDNLLIAGFVVGGLTPRTVLIRALGPQLAQSHVSGVLADPKIAVYSNGSKAAENDNWSDADNAATVATTTASVGATTLSSGSKDAALLVTLNPGVYSALVTGVGGATGVAQVEIFEVP